MKNTDIEQKLQTAVNHMVPDVLDNILSGCTSKEGKVIEMADKKNRKKKWTLSLSGIAASLILVLGLFFGLKQVQSNNIVDSIIALDVNPSIELKVNKKEKVLEANALNEEARIILDGMNLKNTDLNVAINALIGASLKNGFIDRLANSVLISVENPDKNKGIKLKQKLAEEINLLLLSQEIKPAILSQAISSEADLDAYVKTYNISFGKAALIDEILNYDRFLDIKDLAKMSINDLNLLMHSKKINPENISSIGTASEESYIGETAAKEIAFRHTGITESDVQKLEIEIDIEKGRLVYEIEFFAGGYEYELDIDAHSGEIIDFEKEEKTAKKEDKSAKKEDSKTDTSITGQYIGKDEAIKIALNHAGVSESSVNNLTVELDREDGVVVYEVEFLIGNTEYEYEINALTGEIVGFEKEEKHK